MLHATICLLLVPLMTQASSTELRTPLVHSIIPSSAQVANITRSRVAFVDASSAGAGFTMPAVTGVEVTADLSGSISITGILASDLENCTEGIARTTSERTQEFFLEERERLREEAGDLYFSFFQAVATYGFSDNNRTQDIISSIGYQTFSRRSRRMLHRLKPALLQARFRVRFNGVSNGETAVFVYVQMNEITLMSGEKLVILQDKPRLVVVDQNGNEIDRAPKLEGEFTWMAQVMDRNGSNSTTC